MTTKQILSTLFAKKDSLVDCKKILEYYAQWDQGGFDFFDEYLDERDEMRLVYLWRFMEAKGIAIRPTGHEFIDAKNSSEVEV